MARARNIKPGFFLNDDLGTLPALARLLFAGLWCIADRDGRLADKPNRIKVEILPYDDCDINSLLDMLQQAKFILRYSVGQENFITITNFKKHQNPHKNETPSEIPPPQSDGNISPNILHSRNYSSTLVQVPEHSGTSTVQAPYLHSTTPADSLNLIPDSIYSCSTSEVSDAGDEDIVSDPILVEDVTDAKGIDPNEQDCGEPDNASGSDPILPPKKRTDENHSRVMDDALELTELLVSKMRINNPQAKIPVDRGKWHAEMERLLRIDKRPVDEARTVITWSQENSFWQANILSPGKLREKYDQLLLQSRRSNKSIPFPSGNMRHSNFEQRTYSDEFFDQLNNESMNRRALS